jgi:hypothetical protein
MTLTAMTAPLQVKGEITIPLKQLLASDRIVAGLLVLAIITMIVVTVWSIARLLPDGLSPGHLAFSSTYDCRNGLEYCSSLSRPSITWPLSFSSTAVVAP